MVKESLPEVYISILIVFYSAFIAFGRRVRRGCCRKWRLREFKLRSAKTSFHGPFCGANEWQRFEKDAPMKPFPVAKRFPSPRNHAHHRPTNDQLLPPPPPPLPPPPPSPNISFDSDRGERSTYRNHQHRDRQRGRSRARILTTYHHHDHHQHYHCHYRHHRHRRRHASVIAALAASAVCSFQAKAAATVDAAATTSPHTISTPGYFPITSTTAARTVAAAIATPAGDPADAGRRSKTCPGGDTKRYG